MTAYLIPGLGFDHRIFSKLKLPGIELTYLDWIQPHKNESLQAYAKRMASPISSQEPSILIGHSFGGILCQEIALQQDIQKIILISSIQSREELPLHFRILAPFRLEKLFTKSLTLSTLNYWGAYHDYAKGEEQKLVKDMIEKQSDRYLQWALQHLSSWQGVSLPEHTQLVHIHGEFDKTLPIKKVKKVHHRIQKAGHFMVYKRAHEISELIMQEVAP